ncbi:hypothetical protein DSO57_1030741 [Entomophthora muscae]|uniref:Uncharacterized protein n=1 Tax=Entomophthora muscae TaxID=34485 RepID=A0ACC2RRX0_9FUNG|nr:hypothetical protein DSO57_1030741 [Entomophthora muscae]
MITDCVSFEFPQLTKFRSSVVALDTEILSVKNFIPKAEVNLVRVAINIPGEIKPMDIDLVGFQKLKSLILVSKLIHLNIASYRFGEKYSHIEFLSLLCHRISFLKHLTVTFPGLKTLVICCKRILPDDFNHFLSTLFNIQHLSLHIYERPQLIFSLHFQEYAITKLALNFKCHVSSEFFIWISTCLPQLTELSLISTSTASIEDSFLELSQPLTTLFRFVSTQELSMRFWNVFVPSATNLAFIHLKTCQQNNSEALPSTFPHIFVTESNDIVGMVVSPFA